MELDTDLVHQAETAKYVSVISEKLTNTKEHFQNLIRTETPFRRVEVGDMCTIIASRPRKAV